MAFDVFDPPSVLSSLDAVKPIWHHLYELNPDDGLYQLSAAAVCEIAELRKERDATIARHRDEVAALSAKSEQMARGMTDQIVSNALSGIALALGAQPATLGGLLAVLRADMTWTVREDSDGKPEVFAEDSNIGEVPARTAIRQYLESAEGRAYRG